MNTNLEIIYRAMTRTYETKIPTQQSLKVTAEILHCTLFLHSTNMKNSYFKIL